MPGTSNFNGATVSVDRSDESGNVILCKCTTGNIPSAAAGYAIGCLLINTTTGATYRNVGTATSCNFQIANVSGGNQIVEKDTNGLTVVNVLGTTNGISGVIKAVYLISADTTAANITVTNGGLSVCVIVKGTVAGTMVGASTLTNTTIAAGGTMGIFSSSSSGQAFVMIVYSA